MQRAARCIGGKLDLCQVLPELDQGFGDNAVAGAKTYRLVRFAGQPETLIHLAQMPDNLGYAGAINAWLRILLGQRGWRAAWILNPDTAPAPSALRELADYATLHGKGMVGSRIVDPLRPAEVATRGLRWSKFFARTSAVDRRASAELEPDQAYIEAQLDAPSGASLFVTRDLIDRIGLMDERYRCLLKTLNGVAGPNHWARSDMRTNPLCCMRAARQLAAATRAPVVPACPITLNSATAFCSFGNGIAPGCHGPC